MTKISCKASSNSTQAIVLSVRRLAASPTENLLYPVSRELAQINRQLFLPKKPPTV
jgi:hypothetical protein